MRAAPDFSGAAPNYAERAGKILLPSERKYDIMFSSKFRLSGEGIMQKREEKGTPAQYKSAIVGLTPPFVVIELMFVALAVYLFVSRSDQPLYGGVFLILAGILLAIYLVCLFVLRAKAKIAAGQHKNQ